VTGGRGGRGEGRWPDVVLGFGGVPRFTSSAELRAQVEKMLAQTGLARHLSEIHELNADRYAAFLEAPAAELRLLCPPL
jgi:hypothetical protein